MLADAAAGTMLLDYSFAKASLIPQLDQAKAQGYVGAIRYLSGIVEKDIDAAERDAYAAAGMGLAAVWQTSGRPDQSGAPGGRAHCYAAFSQWAALGAPAGSVIFWACDANWLGPNTPFPWSHARDYAIAWHQAAAEQGNTYRTGVYGPSRVVEAALDEGLATYVWQPETWWDSQPRRPDVHLIQMVNSRRGTFGGASVDENQLHQPIPLWLPGGDAGLDLQLFRPATTATPRDEETMRVCVIPGGSLVLVAGQTWTPMLPDLPWPEQHQALVDMVAAGILTAASPTQIWGELSTAGLAQLVRVDRIAPASTAPATAADIAAEIIRQLRP
ncbi:MAG: glycoside hydrolase domain-containing protein [Terricaulis sp.]